MRDYNQIKAFQLADELVIHIYSVTRNFPSEEKYGLTQQIRRAVVSVTSNLVEGCYRKNDKEFVRFIEIAFASLKEAHYQINLSMRLGYIGSSDYKLIASKFIETEKTLFSYYFYHKDQLKKKKE